MTRLRRGSTTIGFGRVCACFEIPLDMRRIVGVKWRLRHPRSQSSMDSKGLWVCLSTPIVFRGEDKSSRKLHPKRPLPWAEKPRARIRGKPQKKVKHGHGGLSDPRPSLRSTFPHFEANRLALNHSYLSNSSGAGARTP